jgi:hypothetical protein
MCLAAKDGDTDMNLTTVVEPYIDTLGRILCYQTLCFEDEKLLFTFYSADKYDAQECASRWESGEGIPQQPIEYQG